MKISKREIAVYLAEVKNAIQNDQYRIERYEHEQLYVFGKDIELLERIGNTKKTVSLYIKFNKLDHCYVIVVSLHEQNYPIKYYFK